MSNNDLETIQTHAGGLLNNSHFNIWYFQATEFRYQKAALSPCKFYFNGLYFHMDLQH